MKYEPKTHQQMIIDHIQSRKRVNVFAGMGMGKTSSTLSAITKYPALVVAPKRVASATWSDECEKWDHLSDIRVSKILGSPKQRLKALKTPADIYTINYDNARWLLEQDLPKFGTFVADESTRLSSFRMGNKRNRAYALAKISSTTPHHINLTGTPTPLGLSNLWGPTWFVDKGRRLGRTYDAFESRWFAPRSRFDDVGVKRKPYPHSLNEITDLMSDVTISIEASDFMSIDEPIHTIVGFDLPTKAKKQYHAMERLYYLEAHDIEAPHAASKLGKCLQIASGFIYDENGDAHHMHDAKLEAFDSIVSEANGANLLVSYWWKEDAKRILKGYPQARILKSDKDIAEWNEGKISMLLAHPLSAGHGLSLQHGGHHLVYYSDYFNMEGHAQILERIGPTRQMMSGYKRPVYVYSLAANDSVELDVIKSHKDKMDLQQIVLGRLKPSGLI